MNKLAIYTIAFLIACGVAVGSCGSFFIGKIANKEGDGISPAQTLTATILGMKRGAICNIERDGYGTKWIKENRPIAAFIAEWMTAPLEWVLIVLVMVKIIASAKKDYNLGNPPPE